VSVAVAVFLRYPERGKVKTRLAATVGDDRALAVYEKLLEHTLATLDALPDRFRVLLCGEPSTPLARYRQRFEGARRDFVLQEGATLGDRLLAACTHALGGTRAVFCIGTDCPGITPSHFEMAARALERHDAVLGPAEDGGYWLLGTKRAEPRLFEKVPWSSDQVAAVTEARFRELRWTWERIATLGDVDTEEDARRFGLVP
jgi:rSAM/selenodomain-associated transferase 1